MRSEKQPEPQERRRLRVSLFHAQLVFRVLANSCRVGSRSHSSLPNQIRQRFQDDISQKSDLSSLLIKQIYLGNHKQTLNLSGIPCLSETLPQLLVYHSCFGIKYVFMLRHLIQVCSSFLSQAHAAPTPEGTVLTSDLVALPPWEEHKQAERGDKEEDDIS